MVAVANKSSRDTSRRIVDKHAELADRGSFGGGVRRFGFAANGVDHVPAEAKWIRWAAAKVIDGRSVSSLAKELDERGVTPVKAQRWSSKTLNDLLISPRVAGLRVFHGEVVGKAAWKPILDPDTHELVKAAIAARGRGMVQPVLVRWCNQILYCSHCGGTMTGSTIGQGRPPVYWCDSTRSGCGRTVITAPKTEAEVERQVLETVAANADRFAHQGPVTGPRVHRPIAPADIAEDEDLLKILAGMLGRKELTLAEWTEATAPVKERIAAAKPVVLMPVIAPAVRSTLKALATGDPSAVWAGLSAMEKREVTRAILRANGDKGWTVQPADMSKRRAFDPTRLVLAAA
jgi:site-specific DNA recombinase